MATDNPEYLNAGENSSSAEIETTSASALEVINRSEHAAMVATANMQANRRSIDKFSKTLFAYATHSQPIAQSMFYSLPRANKQIIGASVRFAEIVAPCWRNNSTGSRMIGETRDSVTAQGVFIDYEANLRNVKEIPRRITNSSGQRFNSDMILTTAKAVLSIAYREAILKGGVPMALWTPAYEQAKLTAVGQAVSMAERVATAMDGLLKLGVTEWQVLNAVGCASPKEMEVDHLLTLKVLREEINKGDRSIEEVFGSPHDKEIDRLFDQLGKNETERRLNRQSFMGNAKGLLEYLQSKLPGQASSKPVDVPRGTSTSSPAPAAAAETQPRPAQQQEQTAQDETQPAQEQQKRGRGRPRKDAQTEQQAEAQEGSEPQASEQTQAQPQDADPQEENASDGPPEEEKKGSKYLF